MVCRKNNFLALCSSPQLDKDAEASNIIETLKKYLPAGVATFELRTTLAKVSLLSKIDVSVKQDFSSTCRFPLQLHTSLSTKGFARQFDIGERSRNAVDIFGENWFNEPLPHVNTLSLSLPHPHPLRLRLIYPPRRLLTYARLAISKEKIEGL